ncbi:translation machinery associated TMA7 [Gloeopeniophorella convolvens]|nr:translation machinery associated TMA7 [Gloeopeniophorella convolvens]
MSGRQGGKLKPLKAPKKEKREEDEEDAAFKAKKKADAEALKAAKDKALKGGAPVGGGIKKSGKK